MGSGLALAFAVVLGACSSDVEAEQGHADPLAESQPAAAVISEPPAAPSLLVGRVLHAVGHARGPDGRAGIHTELVVLPQWMEQPDEAAARTVRLWVPGGRVGRRVRVLSHQPQLHVNEIAVFATTPSSQIAATAGRVIGQLGDDLVIELGSGKQMLLSEFDARLAPVQRLPLQIRPASTTTAPGAPVSP
jgi:hypothetical protein